MKKTLLSAALVAALSAGPALAETHHGLPFGKSPSARTWSSTEVLNDNYNSNAAESVAFNEGNRDLVNIDDNSNTSIKNTNPVSSAHAGPLVTSNNTCMGSTAVGAQGMQFGISVGSTWQDEDCVRRLDAAFMAKMGDVSPARALMCQKDNIREAYEAAGIDCYGRPQVAPPPVAAIVTPKKKDRDIFAVMNGDYGK